MEHYSIVTDVSILDKKIVLLTDLHGCSHGKDNETLISMIDAVSPDIICISGDMTVKNGKHTDKVVSLIELLVAKYPVYYAPGNHEIRMPGYEEYILQMRQMGVHYLTNERAIIDDNIVIYGLDLSEYWYHKCWEKRDMTSDVIEEYLGRCDDECFSILLAHNPEYFKSYSGWGASLTLSGHVHGGILRLPVLGGVISPSLRLFPTYDAGLYRQDDKELVLSRGVGLHHIKLRYFNRPEVSVIDISSGKAHR